MKQQIPPLWVWYIVFPLAAAILFLVGSLSPVNPFYGKERHHLIYQKRLAHFLDDMKQHPNEDECRVLCWGSSLTEQAINFSDTLKEKISNKTGQDIGVYKMFMEDLGVNQLQHLENLFEASLELNPQLILIESFVFIEKSKKRSINTQIIDQYKNTINARFFDRKGRPVREERYHKNFNYFNQRLLRKHKIIDTSYVATKIRNIYNFTELDWIEDKLKPFKEKNIPIIIIDVPRVGSFEKKLRTLENKTQKEAFVNAMRAAGFQVNYWAFNEFLPYSYYNDYAHMNEKGMLYYSNWLTDKITHYFSGQCSN